MNFRLNIVLLLVFLVTGILPPFNLIVQTVSADTNGFDFTVSSFDLPSTVEPNDILSVPISLENNGTADWERQDMLGNNLIEITYVLDGVSYGSNTPLIRDVTNVSTSPLNATDPIQTISIEAPSGEGRYNLEVLLYKNDEIVDPYVRASSPQTFELVVEEPVVLTPDITSPSGSITINSGASTTESTEVAIGLTAEDVEVAGEEKTGVAKFRISSIGDFSDSNWEPWVGAGAEINKSIQNLPGTYTFYVQYKDAMDNESPVYSDSIDFVSLKPIGSIEIDKDELISIYGELQAQDNNFKLHLQASSNVNITEYIISQDSDFTDNSWVAIDSPTSSFQDIIEFQVNDETGDYPFFVKFKNEYLDESDVYTDTIFYQSYEVIPSISSGSDDVLYGGEMILSANLLNTGDDIGYNASFDITLPEGFEYISSLECPEAFINSVCDIPELEDSTLQPTFVSWDDNGNQVISFSGVADLLKGESTSINIKLSVGGLDEGYELGEIVDIPIQGTLFKRNNFKQGVTEESILQVELLPFVVDYNGKGSDGSDKDQLVGDIVKNEIKIRTNPDIDSDPKSRETQIADPTPGDPDNGDEVEIELDKNPLTVEYELDSGVQYVRDSLVIENYSGNTDSIIFEVIQGTSNSLLKWVFSEVLGTEYYDSPVGLIFDTIVPKYDRSQERYIEHNELLESNLNAEGNYTQPGLDINGEPNESKAFIDSETNSIRAKYFTINKSSTVYVDNAGDLLKKNGRAQSGDIIRYTIQIDTSVDYNLSGIEITDVLPDGVSYIGNIQESDDLMLSLFNQTTDPSTGEIINTWRLSASEGVVAGSSYNFSYDVRVDNNYDIKELENCVSDPCDGDTDDRLFSNDNLRSDAELRGLWNDVDLDIKTGNPRSGIDTDKDGTNTYIQNVLYESGIKHKNDTEYIDSVEVKIGDVLDVQTKVTFPEVNPTNDFKYHVYLPVGTNLVDSSWNVISTGSFEKDPNSFEEIEGGYLIDLGKVEPNATFELNYQVEVLDDVNLKIATQVRNLFRSNYYNIDNQKITYIKDVALILTEPDLLVQKQIVDGYIARGEQASVLTTIENIGTDTAFEFSIADLIPENTQFIPNSCSFEIVASEGVTLKPAEECILTGNSIIIDIFTLPAGAKILVNYQIETDESVIYSDALPSSVIISEHTNRASDDPLVARSYPEEVFEFNWKAQEPLLETEIDVSNSVQNLTTSPISYEVGRGVNLDVNTKLNTVGGAPVYNVDVSSAIDITDEFIIIGYSILLNGAELTVNVDDTVEINGNQADLSVDDSNGEININNIAVLNPSDMLVIRYLVETSSNADFNSNSLVQIRAEAEDAFDEEIRKDGCAGMQSCIVESDVDDYSDAELIIQPLDTLSPLGEILFQNGGQLLTTTNQDFVDVLYRAYDQENEYEIPNEIIGVRFSRDGVNWSTLPNLGELDNAAKITYQLDESEGWNAWDGSDLLVSNVLLDTDGSNEFFMEVADSYGNRSIISSIILKDTSPLENLFVSISPFKDDISNPELTYRFDNYINFIAIDSADNSSGLGDYSYCLAGEVNNCFDATNLLTRDLANWSDWVDMQVGINSVLENFPPVAEGSNLTVYMIARDAAGNEFIRSSSEIDPITGKELPTNIVVDSIEFDVQKFRASSPSIAIQLNDDEQYTSSPVVTVLVEVLGEGNGIDQMRFAADGESISDSVWMDYEGTEFTRVLFESTLEGNKQYCMQVRDFSGKESNIACDEIILDASAPLGFIVINDGDTQTENRNVVLNIATSDPDLPDGNQGIWGIQMRISKSGENCEFLMDEEREACQGNWSDWEDYDSPKNWTLDNYYGDHSVFIQFQDALGNISEVLSTTVTYNPLTAEGGILINNDDLFTNTKNVNLDLEINVAGTTPVLMRFYQTNGEQPPTPLFVTNPNQNSNGWTYWQEYYSPVQWDFDWNQDINNDDDYGLKQVCVQYKLANTSETQVYCDSIIYAPYYAVEYFRGGSLANFSDSENKIYGLNTVPNQVLSQDEFTINLNARNVGSFAWPPVGDEPVRVSYHWKRIGGEIPDGWTEDLIFDEYRGNSAPLSDLVAWDQTTGQLELKVDTPLLPGEYELVIDTVHEGNAWFKDYGNDAPTYKITVEQNPDKDLPTPDFGVLGVNQGVGGPLSIPIGWDVHDGKQDGWGTNCEDNWGGNNYSGNTCYIQGTWQPPRDTGYKHVCRNFGGHYKYEIETAQGRVFYFCPADTAYWDQFMGDQMSAEVYWYRSWENDGYGGFQINELGPSRLTWDSRFRQGDNDSKFSQTIKVNRSDDNNDVKFTIQPKLYNAGTKVWTQSNVDLVALDKPLNNGGRERSSLFYDSSTWKSPSRIEIDRNSSGYGRNTLGRFTFDIKVPSDISFGTYQQCFVMTNDPFEKWERRDSFCINIDVEMTVEEQREFFCPVPHPVYEEKDFDSEIIGYIGQNTKFIIKYTENGPTDPETGEPSWSNIYYPSSGERGWILNELDCFGDAEEIENIIPIPEFEVTPLPEGDSGYVINLNGIDVKMGPADKFPTIETIPYGAHVQVLGEVHMDDNQYGGWLYVRLDPDDCTTELAKAQSCEGWIPNGAVHHTNDPKDIVIAEPPKYYRAHVCGNEEIKAYRYPGVKVDVVGSIIPAQNVSVLRSWRPTEDSKVWYQVYLNKNGDTGWIESFDGLCEGFEYPIENPVCAGELGYPYAQEWPVTSEFGPRWGGQHRGIDIGANYGTPVLAAEDGYVTVIARDGFCPDNIMGTGLYVDVYHPKYNLTTRYLHLSKTTPGLSVGDNVPRGMVLGETGNTGCVIPRPTSENPLRGTHLHFEVIDNGNGNARINPRSYWQGGSCSEAIAGDQENTKDQTQMKDRFLELVEKKEESYIDMKENVKGIHLYTSGVCKVWVKEYDFIFSEEFKDPYFAVSNFSTKDAYSGGALIYNDELDKVILVANEIWEKYLDIGGPCNNLIGLPKLTEGFYYQKKAETSEKSRRNGFLSWGEYQKFQKGNIYSHFDYYDDIEYSIVVKDEILREYESSGETTGKYGFPLEDVDEFNCQRFEFGSIPTCDIKSSKDLFKDTNSTLENLLKGIEILERYYDNKTISGLLFRYIYEPEGIFDPSAPETVRFKRGNSLPSCSGENCIDEVEGALQYISLISRCDTLEEINNGTDEGCVGKAPGKYVNLSLPFKSNSRYANVTLETSHLFAGISENYFNNVDLQLTLGSQIITAGQARLDKRSRTYVGDLGGVIQRLIRTNDFEWKEDSDDFKKFPTNLINNNLFAQKAYEGLFEKYDIEADIDSYMINRILNSDSNKKLSQAISEYYNSDLVNKKHEIFLEEELDMPKPHNLGRDLPDQRYRDLSYQVFAFAIMFDYGSRANAGEVDCFVFNDAKCVAEIFFPQNNDYVTTNIFYSGIVTQLIYNYMVRNAVYGYDNFSYGDIYSFINSGTNL